MIFNLAAEYPINKQWILLLEMYSTWTWSNPDYGIPGLPVSHHRVGLPAGDRILSPRKRSAFSAGCAFDTIGKFGGHKVTPAFTAYYSF